VIEELLQRVRALEEITGAAANDASVVPMAAVPSKPPDPATPMVPKAKPSPTDDAGSRTTTAAAPGQVTVDEDAAERALERSLVQAGALLLPFGKVEVSPSLTYTRREDDAPVITQVDGTSILSQERVERDEVTADLGVLVGLPFESQLELGLPYNYAHRERKTEAGFVPIDSESDSGSAFGDFRIGVAKTFVREVNWIPNLIGRVTWDTNTGEKSDGGVALGGGFNELQASVTATKRQDPLVFAASAGYEKVFESNDIEPGDAWSFSLGTFLAVSPDSSLRFAFSQTFRGETEFDGRKLDGSDQSSGTFTAGLSSVLGHGALIDFSGGIGLGNDAPDYFFGVALPIRFNVPVEDGR
jgi:hypothetical protein